MGYTGGGPTPLCGVLRVPRAGLQEDEVRTIQNLFGAIFIGPVLEESVGMMLFSYNKYSWLNSRTVIF